MAAAWNDLLTALHVIVKGGGRFIAFMWPLVIATICLTLMQKNVCSYRVCSAGGILQNTMNRAVL